MTCSPPSLLLFLGRLFADGHHDFEYFPIAKDMQRHFFADFRQADKTDQMTVVVDPYAVVPQDNVARLKLCGRSR